MTNQRREDWIDFIKRESRVQTSPFVPEISLHLANAILPIWEATESRLATCESEPPYWAFAWPGGQALARFILDGSIAVAGARILDLACGCGIAGIAAGLQGGRVTENDIDPLAMAACRLNAGLNGVELAYTCGDLLESPPGPWDIVLAGDLFYEKTLAIRVGSWLREQAQSGVRVLVGDPGRLYLPEHTFRCLRSYATPTLVDLESAPCMQTRVLTLDPDLLAFKPAPVASGHSA